MSPPVCPACGEYARHGQVRCEDCGTRIYLILHCVLCGTTIYAGKRTCLAHRDLEEELLAELERTVEVRSAA